MRRSTIILYGFISLFLLFALWVVSINNTLVRREEGVKAAWSQVENVYQRRSDLVPNLVNTVKGYAAHEKQTLERVIRARSEATKVDVANSGGPIDSSKLQQFSRAQEGLSSALSRLLVVVERYPDLKANQNFRDLQVQLEGTENRISVERRRFNEVAQEYNAYLRVFPQSIVANMRGFQARPYFEAQQGSAIAPKVEF